MNTTNTADVAEKINQAAKELAKRVENQHGPYGADRRVGTARKVFISEVCRVAGVEPTDVLHQFIARRVRLTRCDLAHAYDTHAVGASELAYLNARFHFVEVV